MECAFKKFVWNQGRVPLLSGLHCSSASQLPLLHTWTPLTVRTLHGTPDPSFLLKYIPPASTAVLSQWALLSFWVREARISGLHSYHISFTPKTLDSSGWAFPLHLALQLPSDMFLPLCWIYLYFLMARLSLSLQPSTCPSWNHFLRCFPYPPWGSFCSSACIFGIPQCVNSALGSVLTSVYQRDLPSLLCWWLQNFTVHLRGVLLHPTRRSCPFFWGL